MKLYDIMKNKICLSVPNGSKKHTTVRTVLMSNRQTTETEVKSSDTH